MITEEEILVFLKAYGIVNKQRLHGEWVLPRPLQGSFELEKRYERKEKPETTLAKRRIKALNKRVLERYMIPEELLKISPFGKTYKLIIDKDVLAEMNKVIKSR